MLQSTVQHHLLTGYAKAKTATPATGCNTSSATVLTVDITPLAQLRAAAGPERPPWKLLGCLLILLTAARTDVQSHSSIELSWWPAPSLWGFQHTFGHLVGAESAGPSLMRNELLIFLMPGFRCPLSSTMNSILRALAGCWRVLYLVLALPYCNDANIHIAGAGAIQKNERAQLELQYCLCVVLPQCTDRPGFAMTRITTGRCKAHCMRIVQGAQAAASVNLGVGWCTAHNCAENCINPLNFLQSTGWQSHTLYNVAFSKVQLDCNSSAAANLGPLLTITLVSIVGLTCQLLSLFGR